MEVFPIFSRLVVDHNITPWGVLALAHRCSSLRILGIRLNTSSLTMDDVSQPVAHPALALTSVFDGSQHPVQNPRLVAAVLSGMFPNAEFQSVLLEHKEAWDEVARMSSLFRAVRTQVETQVLMQMVRHVYYSE